MILLTALALNSILLPGDVAIYSGTAAHVLVTSTRRDVLPAGGALIVPAEEAAALEDPAKFWRLFSQLRFHDYAQKSTKVAVGPRAIERTTCSLPSTRRSACWRRRGIHRGRFPICLSKRGSE